MQKNTELLELACNAWDALRPFRDKRQRLIRFTFGDQWSDLVDDGQGHYLSERQLLDLEGRRPITVNMLRRLVRLLVGRYRTEAAESGRYAADDSVGRRNNLGELDARVFEEFIISGCAVQRVVAERRPDGSGVWIDNVDPCRMFVNGFTDPRGSDIELIGMFHDMSWPQFVNRFGRNSASRMRRLRQVFSSAADCLGATTGMIRVAEVWNLDARLSRDKNCFDMAWRCRFIAPDGTVVGDSLSAYPHRSHPFALKFYPLIDGEIHSFVEDLIDAQKSVNRMLTSFEATMSSSAKGALLFPVDQLVRGMSLDDIGKLWAHQDSVIPVTGRGNELPQQMITNNASSGIVPIIEMQLRLFEEASGISEALMGKALSGSIGSDMYRTILANADTGIADLLESFRSFLDGRDRLAATSCT